jgi:quinol monooxygenase YgiN
VIAMIIVSGYLMVEPARRDDYLASCVAVVRSARAAAGCIDFHLSADPIEPGRVNIFEHWTGVEAVEAFRGSGPSDDHQASILDAKVDQHEIARTTSLS